VEQASIPPVERVQFDDILPAKGLLGDISGRESQQALSLVDDTTEIVPSTSERQHSVSAAV